MIRKYGIVLLIGLIGLVLLLNLAARGPTPEEYTIRGQQIEGIVTVVSRERVEFEGRVTGDPNTAFWFFSQEEGVGEGSPNWTPMRCTVSTTDSSGNAYIFCFAEFSKKYRQNALVLANSDDPQDGQVERIEYRANLVIGEQEQSQTWDYVYQQLGIQPDSIANAMQIYYSLGLEMEVNADYNRWPPNYQDSLDERYTYAQGWYLTFSTNYECDGQYTDNFIQLYRWNGSEFAFADQFRLEDVDFDYESGKHDFSVEGYTMQLTYLHDNDCNDQDQYVTIP